MANHVYTTIEIRGIDRDNKTIMDYIGERFSHLKGTYLGDAFYDEKTEEKVGDEPYNVYYLYDQTQDSIDREWMIENVGSKWCYLEDLELFDDTLVMRTTSAWSYPEEFVCYIVESFHEKQQNLTVFVNYEDEMPNFYGCEVYINGECEDGFSCDDEEIEYDLRNYSSDYARLSVAYEESDEDMELYDELVDLKMDILYEMFSEEYHRVFSNYQ